jgi:hypothetical protein
VWQVGTLCGRKVPIARAQVPELRARRALRLGGEGALFRQAKREEARHRPPGKRARLARRAHCGQMVERPAQLARAVVRRENQPRLAMHSVAVRSLQARDPGVRAAVLPAEDRRERAPGGAVPAHAIGALAGKARAADFGLARAEPRERLRHGAEDRGHHLLAVLFSPARLRARQADLDRAARVNAPRLVQHQRAAGVRALVDGEHQAHGTRLILRC